MAVDFYMDVHVPQAITGQLRRHGVNVLTAIEDNASLLDDADLLERSTSLARILFTQDIRFKALAEQWQREGRPFAGLIFCHQLAATIGQIVRDLELVNQATQPEDWASTVLHLPL